MERFENIRESGKTQEEALTRLTEILSILRKECPWDREQTHESLRICMLEEAYEACGAIDERDMDNLEEELGDVLLQVLFHSQLAAESGNFDLCRVINQECEKMIRRHPHVFSKDSIKSVDKAIEKWENVKRTEKGNLSCTERLQSVPSAMPALIRGYKIQSKAAEVGFDWEDVSGAFHKVEEELAELLDACQNKGPNHQERIAEELGDLLFSVVNVSRFLKVNPEQALNATSKKFIKRFAFVEKEANLRGQRLEDMPLEEMDKLWEEAKRSGHVRKPGIMK